MRGQKDLRIMKMWVKQVKNQGENWHKKLQNCQMTEFGEIKFLHFFPDLDTNFPDHFRHFARSLQSEHEMIIATFIRCKSRFFIFMVIILKRLPVTDFFEKYKSSPTTLFLQVFP